MMSEFSSDCELFGERSPVSVMHLIVDNPCVTSY